MSEPLWCPRCGSTEYRVYAFDEGGCERCVGIQFPERLMHWLRRSHAELLAAVDQIDDLLLKFAFDEGGLDDNIIHGLSVDPYGIIGDLRRARANARPVKPK